MSEWFLKKTNIIVSVLAIVVLFGLIIFAANIEIKDLDLWLHLATGKYIVDHGVIPRVDILSGTLAGTPWINHEWLFQVIVHLLYDSFGPDGLIALQVVLVGLIFVLLLMLGYREEMQLIPIGTLFCVFMVLQLRFTHRPDLFSLMFFVVYFCILAFQSESKLSIFILFIVQILWNNIHGFFILGPIIIFIGLLGEWVKRHVPLPWEWSKTGRFKDDEYLRLKYAFGIVLLACLFNPHFIKGALYPLNILLSVSGKSKVFFSHIGELRKPISLSTLFVWNRFFYYKLLIVLSSASFVLNRKKLDVGLLLFWTFFLIFSLNANRNVVYFALAAYLAIIANMQQFLTLDKVKSMLERKKIFLIGSMAMKVWLIVFMLHFGSKLALRGYFDFDHHVRKSEYSGGLSLRNFPYKAANFLVENDIKGNFFNDFNSGAYLLGRCFPQIKVFIDGRTEVYGADYFQEYRKAYDGDLESLHKILDKYNLTGAFLGSVYAPASKNTIAYFYKSDDWALVYFDYDATIFLKKVPENEDIITRYQIDLKDETVEAADLVAIGVNRVTPYRNINRSNVFYNLGFYEKARQEAQEAIKISPYYSEAYEILGKIDFQNKDYLKALENYRNVKLLGGNDLTTALKIARCYYEIGAYSRAKEQCDKILGEKNDSRALFLLSMINIKEGNIEKGYRLASKAHRLSPQKNDDLKEIGNLLYEKGSFDKAKKILITAVNLEKNEAVIRELNKKIKLCVIAL